MKKFREYKSKEWRIAYLKKWRQDHRKEIREYNKEYFRKWWSVNRERYHNQNRKQLLGSRSTCVVGREFELLALRLLKGSVDRNAENFSGGYDIEWQGKKIDVKVKFQRPRGGWSFEILKTNTATHLLLFCIENNELKRVIFMPKVKKRTAFVSYTNLKEFEVNFGKIELPTRTTGYVYE
jgi:hypothetical protein